MRNIGLQFWSIRDEVEKDLLGMIEKVAEMGYTGIQFAGFYDYTAEEVKHKLAEVGIKVAGAHVQIEQLENNLEETLKYHATIGNDLIIIPFLQENLKAESGIIGTLAASWAYKAESDNSTIIYGEKAILRLEDDPKYSLIVQYTKGEVVKYELGAIQTNEEGGQHTSHVIDHFISAIVNDTEVPVFGEEGLKSLEVVLAVLRSSESKKIVRV